MAEHIKNATDDAPEDRFCDLVMKGGITSGIVYPKAITELSKHYRFKNIGGTSAGAIAAAVTAAAEYQRRNTGSRDGFDTILDKLPGQLGSAMTDSGPSRLSNLFQPQPKTRRLFSVLFNALNCQSTNQRILAIISGFLKAYWPATLVSFVIAIWATNVLFGAIYSASILFFVLLLGVLMVFSIGYWLYSDITNNVVKNGYGLCTGLTEQPDDALTPWLHNIIQEAAGLKESDDPLTFGMLWDAKGFPPDWLQPPPAKVRSINLQMFSTNLAHGRPYIFPVAEPSEQSDRYRGRDRLFFNPDELKPYLPKKLLQWMIDHGRAYALEQGREDKDPAEQDAIDKNLWEIPEQKNFPVLLAARMSLSFPVLLSAIPLWAINYDPDPRIEKRTFCKCWFSDGGISSNFPIHLFDGLVPQWPTFGINLEPEIKSRKITGHENDGGTFLPEKYTQGYGERWDLFEEKAANSAKFGGFISAIISAMQGWNDNSLARMPGVRDRIVRVRLKDSEGGLNLDMAEDVINEIVSRGEQAVNKLTERFTAQSPNAPQTDGWDEQRWVRLCTLLKMLEKRAPELILAFSGSTAHATNFKTLIDNAKKNELPAGLEGSLTNAQAAAIDKTMVALETLMNELNQLNALQVFKSIPEPELRVRPPL